MTGDHALQSAAEHIQTGRIEQARTLLTRLLQRTPNDPSANNLMCVALAMAHRHDQAIFYGRRAIGAFPDHPGFLLNLGNCLALTDKTEEAVRLLTRAVELDPDHLGAATALTEALNASHRYAAGAAHGGRAAARFGPEPDLAIALGASLLNSARPEEAARVLRDALGASPDHPMLLQRLASTLNYVPGADPEHVAEAHRRAGRAVAETGVASKSGPPGLRWHAVDRNPDRPLRVGILSPDLRAHSVAYFTMPMLRHLDRREFEVWCYMDSHTEDAVSARLRALAGQWRNVDELDVAGLVQRIRGDRIDILIELAGYSSKPRLAVPVRRAAPVQVTYIGYPNTTGLPGMDARIVDSLTDPAGGIEVGAAPTSMARSYRADDLATAGGIEVGAAPTSMARSYRADDLATERLVRLDPCFLCYDPLGEPPAVARLVEAPSRGTGGGTVTFGSFNAAQKINGAVLGAWSRLLHAVAGSRLLLKSSSFGEEEMRRDLGARFAAAGVGADRVEFLAWSASPAEHLGLYNRIDVAVDPFPYCGTTTTCEALLMGVPVVSLVGRAHASRVGLSLLSAVGLGELCAQTEERYVAIGVGLAGDRARRAELRETLRGRLLASPLCDGAGFGARLGGALRGMWRSYCAGA